MEDSRRIAVTKLADHSTNEELKVNRDCKTGAGQPAAFSGRPLLF